MANPLRVIVGADVRRGEYLGPARCLRNDGSRQWAYKGKPLYLWIKDPKPGDRTGDGFNKVWHVVEKEWQPMSSGM